MIPDFLRRENRKELSELDKKIENALEEYCRHFPDDGLMTESWIWPREEWPTIINECISQNKTIWELFGEEYDQEADY